MDAPFQITLALIAEEFLLAMACAVPAVIAASRYTKNRAPVHFIAVLSFIFGSVAICCWTYSGGRIVFLLTTIAAVVLWILGCVWGLASAAGLETRELGEGKFKVVGVDRTSRLDCSQVYTADSEANAKVKAELDGIVVTSVERVS